MRIACIGWGSLIWNQKDLLIYGEWYKNGPALPIEFVSQSSDDRLTLVISDLAKPVPTL